MSNNADQKVLKEFLERRHPEYEELLPHWNFVKSCYEGGRSWFRHNIFKYLKEGDREFADRLERCYRFNHTREVVDLVDKYIFKMEISRSEDVDDCVKNFWKSVTSNDLTINEYAKQISKYTSIYGRVWIVVDSTKRSEGIQSVADAKRENAKVYSYIVTPQNMCDASYDENGTLNWCLIHEQVRDDKDPLYSSGKIIDRYRLWTTNDWTLFTIVESDNPADGNYNVAVEGPYTHGLGVVPVFPADHVITHDPYTSPSLIDDVAYLDRAIANYLSNLDAIIQDQTFSQLVIPSQALLNEDEGVDKLREMGTKRIFTYDGTAGKTPEFISPDVKQANLILNVVNKIINEIYNTVGLAGERTKEDNALGIDNSSGVAKAYDFERVNSLLTSKADSLEAIENRLVFFVLLWNGIDADKNLEEKRRYVSYPDNFDVRGLYDEFEIASRLSLVDAPTGIRRYQMTILLDKLFPQLKEDIKKSILNEISEWEPAGKEDAQAMVNSTGSQSVGGEMDRRIDDAQKGNRTTSREEKAIREKANEKAESN